jgi:hypothetical protein
MKKVLILICSIVSTSIFAQTSGVGSAARYPTTADITSGMQRFYNTVNSKWYSTNVSSTAWLSNDSISAVNVQTLDVTQTLNATGNVTAWGQVVLIGATALTTNITITLPTVVGNTNKSIRFVRVDNSAFTVTIAPFAGQTTTLLNAGVELNTQNNAIVVTAIDATTSRQTSGNGASISSVVNLSTAQTIAGAKNFTTSVGLGVVTPLTKLDVFGNSIFGIQTGALDGFLSIGANILNVSTPTKMATANIAAPETALRLYKAGSNTVKYNATVDFQVGSYQAGVNSLSSLNIMLGNGGTHLPDISVMTMQGDRNIGLSNTTPTSTLHVTGSVANSVTSTALAAYTALGTDFTINLTLVGAQALTLPTASTCTGRRYKITNPTVTETKTISTYTDKYGATITAIIAYASFEIQSDGTVWRQISGDNTQKVEIVGVISGTVPSSAFATLTLGAPTINRGGASIAANTFTAPRTGNYLFTYSYAGNATPTGSGYLIGQITAGGANYSGTLTTVPLGGNNYYGGTNSRTIYLVAGQTAQLKLYQSFIATFSVSGNNDTYSITEL